MKNYLVPMSTLEQRAALASLMVRRGVAKADQLAISKSSGTSSALGIPSSLCIFSTVSKPIRLDLPVNNLLMHGCVKPVFFC
jgi:hypothetical protein